MPFDLCVSNRVLSAVPPDQIRSTLRHLTRLCRHIYLNEYSPSDGGAPSDYWFMHDYLALLAEHARYTVLENGRLDAATYYVLRIDSDRGPGPSAGGRPAE